MTKNLIQKNELKLHSAAIQITNIVNLLQRKSWLILLANAFNDLPKKGIYTITVKELMEHLNYTSTNEEHLKTSLKALMTCLVEWNILGKDKKNIWAASTLLSSIEIKNGICHYEFSHFLREKLYNPEIYTKISLLMSKNFNSKHSLALYLFCLDYVNLSETPLIPIEKFKKLLGFQEDEYIEFKILNRNIVKPAIKEINEISDLILKVEYKRQQKRFIALKFYIIVNSQFQSPKKSLFHLEPPIQGQPIQEQEIKKQKEEFISINENIIYEKLITIGITAFVAHNLTKKHPLEKIDRQINWLPYRQAQDPPAMLKKAIEEDWTMPKKIQDELKLKEEEEKLEQLIQQAQKATYIIFSNGAKYNICKQDREQAKDFIKILRDDNTTAMVRLSPERNYKFL